jgi:hypothetical protein
MRIISAITEEPISYSETWVDGYGWYPLKYSQVWVEEYGKFVSFKAKLPVMNTHRVQRWQTLKLHLTIENAIFKLYHIFDFIEKLKLALLSYDVVYGFVTGRTMREIVNFWSCRQQEHNTS